MHDVFLQHGEHVRELNVSDCSMLTTDFTNILSGLPMLESVSFERVQLKEIMPVDSVLTCLNNLKSIVIVESSFIVSLVFFSNLIFNKSYINFRF